jgi:type I restriction-modification system DNA methylase subunit
MDEQNSMKMDDLATYYESILDREVRKEGGIYYTPPLIVDYMVENSLGAILKNKTPVEAAKIRIVDPACGGGVFLMGGYQFLLDRTRHQCKPKFVHSQKGKTEI